MRGAIAVSAEMGGVRILEGEDVLFTYRFNTRIAQQFFCSRRGIYAHHQGRYDPNQYGVNVACLDGVSPFDFEGVPETDGINQPSDTGGVARQAGVLRYLPTA
jgi:hypothetical protein